MTRKYGTNRPPALTPNWVKTGAALAALLRRHPALPRRCCRRTLLFAPVCAGWTAEVLGGVGADVAVELEAPRTDDAAVPGT